VKQALVRKGFPYGLAAQVLEQVKEEEAE